MTTKYKYTAGPWIYEKPRKDDDSQLGYLVGPKDISKGHIVTGACPANPLNEANAKLIAAAPEMLDWLYDCLPAVEESDEFNKPSRKMGPKLRAFLKRVEGEV